MFKGKKQNINPNTTDTVIGEGTVFEGKVKSKASIHIEGQITGDIECEGDVTVGEKGQVNSNITAREVTIEGTVQGNVSSTGKLTIMSTGKLFGNTKTASLHIVEGGIFEGTSKMESSHATTQSKSNSVLKENPTELKDASFGQFGNSN